MMGWQWHQLDHMQIICTSLQTETTSVRHHSFFTSWMLFLTHNQQCQNTECNNNLQKKQYQWKRNAEPMQEYTLSSEELM